jgi:hypothetical protein
VIAVVAQAAGLVGSRPRVGVRSSNRRRRYAQDGTELAISQPMRSVTDRQQRVRRTVGALLTVTPCRKLYVAGWVRIHHGLVGEAVILAAALPLALAARAALVALGVALVWDDRHDWPFPIRDRIN